MEVKFILDYGYEPDEPEPFRCRLHVGLPTESGGRLPPQIQSAQRLLGERLCPYWGNLRDGDTRRWKEVDIRGLSWEDVTSKAKIRMENIVETLRLVIATNRRALCEMPQTQEITVTVG